VLVYANLISERLLFLVGDSIALVAGESSFGRLSRLR
jgi:hypothetical protein